MFDSSNGNFDIQKSHINDKGYFVVTAGETNNGILGKSDIEARIFEANTITIDMFGFVFFRQFEYKMVTHARVFSLKPKFKITHKQGLFLASLFKHLKTKFGYDNMCSWAKIKDDKIQLPINKDGDIDFEFMESFVAELEAERVAELEAYLAAASLKDYELTADELSALSKFENYNWGEFRIGDLFTSKTGDTDLQQKDINGKGEYFLNSGYTNCGVNGKTDRPARIFLKNTITIDFLGYVFYRNFDYKMATHNHIFSLSGEVIKNEKIGLFLVTSLSYLKNLFSFSNMGTWTKFKDLNIKLPITASGEIDFEFMNNFIKAIKKLVIKDVVLYTDNKIKATKSIVSSNQ